MGVSRHTQNSPKESPRYCSAVRNAAAIRDTDAGSRVVVPFLRAQGVERLDGFIVTHDDSDHSGVPLPCWK